MIKLTKIHGSEFYVNEDNILWIENLPDTTITFLNGAKVIVKENLTCIIELMNANKSNRTSSEFSVLSETEREKIQIECI